MCQLSAPVGVGAPPGQEIHQLAKGSKISMSKVTELASGQITRTDALTIDLVQPTDMPPAVLIRWPVAPSVLAATPRAIAKVAAALMRIMADAQTRLAGTKSRNG
jgi:hypothetical protein